METAEWEPVGGAARPARRFGTTAVGVIAATVGVLGIAVTSYLIRERSSDLPRAGLSGRIALSASARTVPWLDQPAPRGAIDGRVMPMALAPVCLPDQLHGSLGGQGAWHGAATQEVELTNVGPAACTLSSRVSVRGGGPSGAAAEFAVTPPAPLRLEAGQHIAVSLEAAGTCAGAGHLPDRVLSTFTVELGGVAQRLDGGRLDIACGSLKAEIMLVDNPPATSDSARQNVLTARYLGPRAAARGSTLSFAVSLSASVGRLPAFRSCPMYTVVLNQFPRIVSKSYVLNCHAPGTTGKTSAVYSMRLQVPTDMRPGAAKLGWMLDGGAFTGIQLELT